MVTLVDTSVWVEFLRGGDEGARAYVRQGLGQLATTEPVLMELLAGARPGLDTTRLERLLLGQRWLGVDATRDYRGAVDVFHAARAAGHPPRSLQDCLIAAIALRHSVAVVHRDADFAYIAAATGLQEMDLR